MESRPSVDLDSTGWRGWLLDEMNTELDGGRNGDEERLDDNRCDGG